MPILFKMKKGYGKHYIRLDGKNIVLKPGDEVRCEPMHLSGAMDKFERLEPEPPPPIPTVGLRLVDRGDGTYDVINDTSGEPINDEPLMLPEASKLAHSFEHDSGNGNGNGNGKKG